MKFITKNILILSCVSLLTDISSEMLYPIIPIYLKSLGYTVVLIGIIEGVGEGFSGLCKGYFGELSDRRGVRVPFVKGGYWLSALARPLMGVFTFPAWIFGTRSLDFLGKGIRTSARDALLSDESPPSTKATVFGFHRAMDTLGAVIGPCIALLYLHYYPTSYRTMFFIAFAPAVLAGLTVLLLRQKQKPISKLKPVKWAFISSFGYIKHGPKEYKKVVLGLFSFTLFNSSNAFLILKVKEKGFSDTTTIWLYIFYNLIYAAFSFPFGKLADRIGVKTTFVSGLILFAITYLGMGLNSSLAGFYILFFIYGLFMASTEGIAKAWITNLCAKEDTGKALGVYSGLNSILTLFASTIAGLIWYNFSPQTTFILTGSISVIVIIYFLIFIKSPIRK